MDELPTVLWAYQTTIWVSTGKIPFNLVHVTEALILIESSVRSPQLNAFEKCDSANNFDALRTSLDLIEEQRDRVTVQIVAYHKRIASYYNSQVKRKPLNEGDLVIRKSAITNVL